MLFKNPKLFTDPTIHYPTDDLNLAFSDYITQCKNIIQQTRLDLADNAEKIITANTPFELRPTKSARYGVLLIHGLMDSPFLFREIAEHLQTQDLLVRSIVLPGHGTVPGALLHVDFHDWLKAVQYGFHSLTKEVDKVFLMGFSTGANLAIHQAIQHPTQVAGIILLSPAIAIHYPFASLSNWPVYLSHVWPNAAWFHKDREETIDYAKYRSLPFNAVYQVYRSTLELKKINSIDNPLFFVVSEQDKTVRGHDSIRYFQNHHHPDSRMILYSERQSTLNDPRIIQRKARYPNDNIVGISHVALPFSAKNPHYGEYGDYCYASLKSDVKTIYGEFRPHEMTFHNYLCSLHLSQFYYKRLSFNPDFAYMMDSIIKFIENTQKDPYN